MSEPGSDAKIPPDTGVVKEKDKETEKAKQHDDWKFISIEILQNQKKCRQECPFYSYDCFFQKMTDKRDFLKR